MDGRSGSIDSEWRAGYGTVGPLAARKVLDRLDVHCRRFIELSPFLVLGTSDAEGRQDVSPRGDPPGFVRILDDRHLLLPDRPGNNRLDSLGNIAARPDVALLFFVPGVDETLRVNGKAEITTDAALLAPCAVDGRPPRSGLLIRVEEAFLHCGKALIRSGLWDPERKVARKSLPSLGRMIADQIAGVDAQAVDTAVADEYRNELY
ncbi:MAG: pyridoxamine 5'-phosphate oxidase family protein [Geminicoccaceae bacterium]